MPANTQTGPHPYSAAHFALELDGITSKPGVIRSVEGGAVKAEVITYAAGNTFAQTKQLGKPKYDDIKISCGMAMTPPYYRWIEEFFTGKGSRKNGAIVAADFAYKEKARREFYGAIISELQFPKLDSNDKNPLAMTVTLAAEKIRFEKGTDKDLMAGGGREDQKAWTAAHFHFKVDELESKDYDQITKVDGFSIKQKVIDYAAGNVRDGYKVPGRMEFPTLSVYLPECFAGSFIKAFTTRGIKGGTAASRMTGHLICLDNTTTDRAPLLNIDIFGIDIVSITADKSDASSEELKMLKIELTTENMKFNYLSAAS